MNIYRRLTIKSKVIIVLGFLYTIGLFGVALDVATAIEGPSLLFSETTKSVAAGETFEVDIIVDTVGQTSHGVGAKINFDPKILEVVSIEPGTIFGDYPVASFDNTSGKIIVSGIASSSRNYFKDRGVFATLTFRARSQGTSTVQFMYEPGSTTDSNIAVTYGTGDILTQVSPLSVNVSPATQDSLSTPSTDEPSEQTPERVSFFTKLLRFLGLVKEPSTTTSEGRSSSEPISAYGSIPSQQPITDASQEQPLSVTSSPEDKPLARLVKIFLAIVLVVILALLGKRFFFKPKKKGATVFHSIDTNEDDRE